MASEKEQARSDEQREEPEFLNAQAIASAYPISVSTVWAQLRKGRFPEPVEVGRKRLWRRGDVEMFFKPRSRTA